MPPTLEALLAEALHEEVSRRPRDGDALAHACSAPPPAGGGGVRLDAPPREGDEDEAAEEGGTAIGEVGRSVGRSVGRWGG